MKKIAVYAALVAVIMFIIMQQDQAAAVRDSVGDAISDAAQGIGTFLGGL